MIKGIFNNILQRGVIKRFQTAVFRLKNIKSNYPEEIQVIDGERILVLAPHPDDESIGCGGVLLRYAEQIQVLCLTSGGLGIEDSSEEETKIIRRNEFDQAMQFAQVNSEMLQGKDGELFNTPDLLLGKGVQGFDKIFLPNPFDTHIDHCAVVQLIRSAHRENAFASNVQFYLYEVWSTLPNCNQYLDISNSWMQKAELLSFYQSQNSAIDYADRILALNRFRGMAAETEYAESFLQMDIETLLACFP